ncbi:MAG: hypothetical protein M1822_008946 [Bathelium mastoideum]|nr:MAG: hypothetical protein M1822_008946 [Bathelium mastoideum]
MAMNGGQVRSIIAQRLHSQPRPPGWQQTFEPNQRVHNVFQLYSNLHLLVPNNLQRCLQIAINFENNAFRQQPSKDAYLAALREKQEEITRNRANKVGTGIALGNMNPMGMVPPHTLQNGMPGQAPHQGPQAFNSQLQRPMQATPLPQNPPNPYAQGMPNTTGMATNQQATPQNLQGQQQSLNALHPTEHEMQQVNMHAQQRTQQMSQEEKTNLLQNMTPQHREQASRSSLDPIFWYVRQQMTTLLIRRKRQQLQNNNVPPGQNMMAGMGGAQGSHPGFGRPPQQMQTSQPASSSFSNNQDVNVALLGQQADAQKSQEAGQLVVPASNNPNVPQQMPSQQPMGGQNPMMQQQMFANQQQQQQQNAIRAQQARSQAQQLKAAQMAQNRNMSLQGQIGGLNGSQPSQQSPAMPNLNRPMVPPGSNTPQPRPQQGGPSGMQPSPVPMENRISQQGQMNFPNAQRPTPTPNAPNAMQMNRNALIPPNIPPQARQKLLTLQEPQFQVALRNIQQAAQQQQMAVRNNGGQAPGQQQFPMQPGRPQMPQNALQSGPQQLNINGQPQSIGPNQQQQVRPNNKHEIQRAFLNSPGKIAEWDQKPAPPQLRAKIPGLPEQAQLWGQVKNYVANAPLPQTLRSQILNMQSAHFEHFYTTSQQRQHAGLNNAGPAGNMGNQNASSMAANGPAPPAPMVAPGQQQIPPQARMGMQPQMPMNANMNAMPNMSNMNNMGNMGNMGNMTNLNTFRGVGNVNIEPPTAQEVAALRQRYGAKVGHLSDDELRNQIWQSKVRRMQNPPNASAAQQQANPMNPQFDLGPNLMQQNRPQVQPAGLQLQQPQPSQTPKAQVKPGQASAKPAQQPPPSQAQQNSKKRPASNDDVVEIPPPKVAKQSDAPHMQQSKSQQGAPKTGLDQVANLKPEDKAKTQEQLRQQFVAKASANAIKQQNQANGASAATNGQAINSAGSELEDKRKLRAQQIMKEIHDSLVKNTPPKSLSQDQLHQLGAILQQSGRVVDPSIKHAVGYYVKTADEDVLRKILQPALLVKSIPPGVKSNRVLATPDQLKAALNSIMQSVTMLRQAFASMGQQDKAAQPQPTAPDKPSEPQQQLTPANLQQHLKDMNMARQASLHKRSNSKTPSAPTSAQPPFSFGAPSPSGAPLAYGEGIKFNSDNLAIPASKKYKTQSGSAVSTPGQPTPGTLSSPQLTKSPSLKRAYVAEPAKPTPPKNTFKCKHDNCENHVRGFETQQELDKHNSDVHPAIGDPLAFLIDSVAEADGCNPDGTVKERPVLSPKSKKAQIKSMDSENSKAVTSSATSMARTTTQTGAQASPSKTPHNQSRATVQAPASGASAAKDTAAKTLAADKDAKAASSQEIAQTSDAENGASEASPEEWNGILSPEHARDPDGFLAFSLTCHLNQLKAMEKAKEKAVQEAREKEIQAAQEEYELLAEAEKERLQAIGAYIPAHGPSSKTSPTENTPALSSPSDRDATPNSQSKPEGSAHAATIDSDDLLAADPRSPPSHGFPSNDPLIADPDTGEYPDDLSKFFIDAIAADDVDYEAIDLTPLRDGIKASDGVKPPLWEKTKETDELGLWCDAEGMGTVEKNGNGGRGGKMRAAVDLPGGWKLPAELLD